ncbi:MAG: mechanosensitive ion channel [Bacteroidota bacterium]
MDQFQESLGNLVDKLKGWLNDIIVLLPNLILAAIVMGIGLMLARVVRKWVGKTVRRFSRHEAVNSLATTIITAAFVLLVLMVVLSILKLDTALKSMLAGAGVAGLAIGLALQDPIMNIFSGIMMSTKKAFEIGDLIETNDYFGTIIKINLRSTIIRTPEGQHVLLPNKAIYQNALKNYTVSGERRVDLACGVSYGDDLQKVRKIAVEAIRDNVKYNEKKNVELFFDTFGDSSINFQLRFWLKQASLRDFLAARSEAIIALKTAFDENDIMIPFPIRTLDFGIRGGEKLDSVLPAQASKNGSAVAQAENN